MGNWLDFFQKSDVRQARSTIKVANFLQKVKVYLLGKDQSFGVVPIIKKDQEIFYLLIQHKAGHWGFPKGHQEKGESEIEVAKREFLEETGISGVIIDQNTYFTQSYIFSWMGKGINKDIKYFLGKVQNTKVVKQEKEIQSYKWVSFQEAQELIKFASTQKLLIEIDQQLQSLASQDILS